MSRPFLSPLRARTLTTDGSRKVTWLELFFDLIFAAAVAQLAEPMREHYTAAELVRFTPLFVLIWLAWTGHALFCTRFDTDDGIQCALTLAQMFAVAVMAANAKDALDSRSSAGFAAAYAAVRLVLVAQYWRARHIPEARELATRYVTGHGVAAALWIASSMTPVPARFWLWAAAFTIDLGTPWLAVPHAAAVPPDSAHLPERFGLFTLILLGESVVAVMQGIESQEDWTPAAATSAFLGMGISFLIWWWYFDGAGGASEQRVRTTRDAVRFHFWSYAHVPLSIGIIVSGVGVKRIVTAASHAAISPGETNILVGAAAVVMLAMHAIGACSGRGAADRRRASTSLAFAAAALGAAALGRITSPVPLVATVAAACFAQAATTRVAPEDGDVDSPRGVVGCAGQAIMNP
jgi:low temperature requirement protein LtrA